MIRRLFRIGLLLGLVGGVAFALTKLLGNQSQDAPCAASEPWPRLRSDPTVGRTADRTRHPRPRGSRAEDADQPRRLGSSPPTASCPTSHPVKAKMASKIFHLPGMANYERTNPDRCYVDAAQAEADGLAPPSAEPN